MEEMTMESDEAGVFTCIRSPLNAMMNRGSALNQCKKETGAMMKSW